MAYFFISAASVRAPIAAGMWRRLLVKIDLRAMLLVKALVRKVVSANIYISAEIHFGLRAAGRQQDDDERKLDRASRQWPFPASRAAAFACPISGSKTASSGPVSAPVRASRSG